MRSTYPDWASFSKWVTPRAHSSQPIEITPNYFRGEPAQIVPQVFTTQLPHIGFVSGEFDT